MVADLNAAVPDHGPNKNLPLSVRYKPVVISLCLIQSVARGGQKRDVQTPWILGLVGMGGGKGGLAG